MAQKERFEILKLVQEVYERESYSADQKGLRFTFSVSHKVPTQVYGDRSAVRQALSTITKIAITDCIDGSIEINVDLMLISAPLNIVKFTVTDSSKLNPYWFSVSLESVSSKQTA